MNALPSRPLSVISGTELFFAILRYAAHDQLIAGLEIACRHLVQPFSFPIFYNFSTTSLIRLDVTLAFATKVQNVQCTILPLLCANVIYVKRISHSQSWASL